MSAPAPKASPTFGAYDLAAFLVRRENEAVFAQFCERQMIGSSHVQRGSIDQAIQFVEKQPRSPRVLVVDITGIDMPLPAIDRLADACEPGVKVIVVGEHESVPLFRELIQIGVADYLVAPLNIDLVTRFIGPELDPAAVRRGSHSGKVVTFTGTRGGVGATSLATAFAWLLSHRMSRRVAFLDLDPHGGGGPMMLDVEVGGLAEVLANADQIDDLFLERTMVGPDARLMCLSAQEELDQRVVLDQDALEQLLKALEQQFHYIVMDLPRRPGPLYRFALERAALPVLVLDRTLPSLNNAIRTLPLTGAAAQRLVLVLNEHQPAQRSSLLQAEIEQSVGRPIDFVVPYDRSIPDRGDNLGEPLAVDHTPFATAVRKLTASLSGQQTDASNGWMRFLRRR